MATPQNLYQPIISVVCQLLNNNDDSCRMAPFRIYIQTNQQFCQYQTQTISLLNQPKKYAM